MNAAIEVLDEVTHRDLKVDFDLARQTCYSKQILPAVVSEFHNLMFHYPIVFVKDATTGEFTCSVLLGIAPDKHLLKLQDHTSEEALPLNLRRQPLVAIASADDNGPLIGINLETPGVGQGEDLFGGAAPRLELAIAALSDLYRGFDETKNYIKTLVALKLLSPLKVEFEYKNKPKLSLEGLYSIDENKIAQLLDADTQAKDEFIKIARYAYAQNFSLINMRKFTLFSE